jgi:hypothetical protein
MIANLVLIICHAEKIFMLKLGKFIKATEVRLRAFADILKFEQLFCIAV